MRRPGMACQVLAAIVLCHGDEQARLLAQLPQDAFSGADLVLVAFSDAPVTTAFQFPFAGIPIPRKFPGFNAGYNRDQALRHVLTHRSTDVVFLDGDCHPSDDLFHHHRRQLSSMLPTVTFGARYEEGKRDPRESVFLHRGTSYPATLVHGADVLCADLPSIRNHRTVWSCNFGINRSALELLVKDGRLFHPMFDGFWGGEDTGVALAAFYARCRLVGLDPGVSDVQHEPHPPWAVTRKNLERMGEFESTLTGEST